MDIKINSLCPHELVSDNGGGVKFNNGLDLQGLYLYEKYYPYKQEEEYKAAVDAGEDTDGSKAAALEKWKTSPVGIVFKSAAVTQGVMKEIWPGTSSASSVYYDRDGFPINNAKYNEPEQSKYLDPNVPDDKIQIEELKSYYAQRYPQNMSYSPIYVQSYLSNSSSISKELYNGAFIISTDDQNTPEELIYNKSKLKDINARDVAKSPHPNYDYPLTDKYLLYIDCTYTTDTNDKFWDIGGKHMTTNKQGGLCKIYSGYDTGVPEYIDKLESDPHHFFAKMIFCFKQMMYNGSMYDLLSTCSQAHYDESEHGMGTKEALEKAVTDGDAVFVYRDDLLNFTKFVQEKLGVTVV